MDLVTPEVDQSLGVDDLGPVTYRIVHELDHGGHVAKIDTSTSACAPFYDAFNQLFDHHLDDHKKTRRDGAAKLAGINCLKAVGTFYKMKLDPHVSVVPTLDQFVRRFLLTLDEASLKALDVPENHLGGKGFKHVLQLIKKAKEMETLKLSQTGLNAKTMSDLDGVMRGDKEADHTAFGMFKLKEIDVSNNHL